MMKMTLWLTVLISAFVWSAGKAEADFREDFAALLAEGRTREAVDLASKADAGGDAPDIRFALGTAQFLLAIERFGNGLYSFGLGNAAYTGTWVSLADLPFLRVPVPPKPDAEQVTYEGLRALLRQFGEDLAVADATLATIGPEPFDFRVDLGAVALDLDGNGSIEEQERLTALFGAIARVPVQLDAFDFDQSDAPWLRGYTHLVRAMTEFLLAHDWHQAFEETMHFVFPSSELPSSELKTSASAAIAFLQEHQPPPYYYQVTNWNDPNRLSFDNWKQQTPEGRRWAEWDKAYGQQYRRAETYVEFGGIADLIAFIHRFDWPVVEPGRMAASRLHLLQMIDLSRENWRRIQAETDDKQEWLPSPTQTSRFERLRVTEKIVNGWLGFLDAAEDVLEGRKLIAHWRFIGKGVNVRRMFEEPRTFDPVMIAQGAGVIPYLEEGESVSGETAETMLEVFDRGFMAYFLWFN